MLGQMMNQIAGRTVGQIKRQTVGQIKRQTVDQIWAGPPHLEKVHAVGQVLLCCVSVVPLVQTQTKVAARMEGRLGAILGERRGGWG
jgi:hypothetical protein